MGGFETRSAQFSHWQSSTGSRPDPLLTLIKKKMDLLLRELYREFGLKTRITAPLIGRYALNTLKKEEHRLTNEWTYEPRSFYEKNAAALSLENADPAAPEHENKYFTRLICLID